MPSIAIPVSLRGQLLTSSGFSPNSLFAASEPGIWLDPSDLTTLFQDTAGTQPVTAAGQSVARVNDKSGRGNHVTQATAASRPIYRVDANGRPYLEFDGVDDWLVSPTITPGIDKAQVFAGVRKQSDAATGMVAEFGTDSGSLAGSFRLAGPQNVGAADYNFRSRGTVSADAGYVNAAVAAPVTNVLSALGDISGDRSTLRVNGSQVAQTLIDQGTGNFLAYPLYIGRRGGTTLPFNGRIYGLITRFGANLSDDQIAATETWLNQRTGAY